jgi:hypothetical protein
MAEGYAVTATNGAAFAAAMADAQAAVANPTGPLGEAARSTLDGSRGAAPHLSGRLAGAGRVEASGSGGRARIVVATDYAAAIHWGWPGHSIARQPWITKAFRRDPRPLEAMGKGIQSDLDKAAAKT